LGIDEKDQVVVYDTAGVFSACRVYWTFKVKKKIIVIIPTAITILLIFYL
jgi:3-mercaptopyruvate sulfurtransferase SseA